LRVLYFGLSRIVNIVGVASVEPVLVFGK
jgi:hypothetical protein